MNEPRQFAAKIPDAKYGAVEIHPILHVPDWPYADGAARRRHPMGG